MTFWADILSMVGPMHYLQIAPVCRAWNAEYQWQFPDTDTLTSLRSVIASVPLLRWAISHGCLGSCRDHCEGHTDAAYTDLVYAAFDEFPKWTQVDAGRGTCGAQALCRAVAFTGRLDVLACALGADHRFCAPPNKLTCAYAALGGQLSLLQALRAEGCPWDVSVCRCAARVGHLHVLRWAIASGCPWDLVTSWHAAAHGRLRVLIWFAENGCPPDERMCHVAVLSGHLHVLQWLFTQGCAWHARTAEVAARSGHLQCLRWAVRHGCLWDADKCHEVATSCEVRAWVRKEQADAFRRQHPVSD